MKRFIPAQLGSWQSLRSPFVSLQHRVCLCTLPGTLAFILEQRGHAPSRGGKREKVNGALLQLFV